MKYFYVTITEKLGEYEFQSRFLTATDKDTEEYFDHLWKTFRGDETNPDEPDEDGTLWSGSIIIEYPQYEPINTDIFDTMEEYLPVVTR